MLSRKARYALQSLLLLAREQGGRPVLISYLAERGRMPRKFLELILLELKNQGIVQSKKGKGGGYFLAKPAHEVAFGKVIRLIDGPLAPIPCVSQTAYQKCTECQDENTCGIRMVMKEVRDAIAGILDATTVEDVLKQVRRAEANQGLMYYI